jgi:hypothetical protein
MVNRLTVITIQLSTMNVKRKANSNWLDTGSVDSETVCSGLAHRSQGLGGWKGPGGKGVDAMTWPLVWTWPGSWSRPPSLLDHGCGDRRKTSDGIRFMYWKGFLERLWSDSLLPLAVQPEWPIL